MKKIVFVTQVISLLSILPVIMILEFNHVSNISGGVKPPASAQNEVIVVMAEMDIK
jgi:hypothetical protein